MIIVFGIIFLIIAFFASIGALVESGNPSGLIVVFVLGAFLWAIVQNGYKTVKTGSYQQDNTTAQTQRKTLERVAIEYKYGVLESERLKNPMYKKEMKDHSEKWAEPGTEAYEEIKQKEAAWDKGERW